MLLELLKALFRDPLKLRNVRDPTTYKLQIDVKSLKGMPLL